MEIKLNKHSFTINPGSNRFFWKKINTIDWEPDSFRVFDYFINSESVVFDIGSWSGVLSLYAAKTAKKVHAIDPDPVCFRELCSNINLNPDICHKIIAYQEAIYFKEVQMKLHARTTYGASSTSVLQRKRDKVSSFKINTTTLNKFIETHNIKQVNFIKIDIEGAEFFILPTIKQAIETLQYPDLYISFHTSFLNEFYYNKKIPFLLLNKLLMKFEHIFKFPFFKQAIIKDITSSIESLKHYKYIYQSNGALISYNDLKQNPLLIKNNSFVFTNTKWI